MKIKQKKSNVKKKVSKTNPIVLVETNYGDFKIELHKKESPTTVDNFLRYVKDDFYSDTLFHRVIPKFMIQGGGMNTEMKDKTPSYDPIVNEASSNGLKNIIGTVAMARTNDPNSATSQFFINVADNDFLNHTPGAYGGDGYAVFGNVTEGMEVVNNIENLPTNDSGFHSNVPVEPVLIKKIALVPEEAEK